MAVFNQEKFNHFIIDNDVVGFFETPITLKSGRDSCWYVNWRDVSNDSFLLVELSNYVHDFTTSLGLEPDTFYGVPEGATKLAIYTQIEHAKKDYVFGKGSHVVAMGRGKTKEHGVTKNKYFLGEPRGKTVVLEDVTTTGGSLINTIDTLRELDDLEIIAAIGLTNRMELNKEGISVDESLRKIGFSYFSMSKGTNLLQMANKKYNPSSEIRKHIEKEFKEYGVEMFKFV